MSASKVRIGLKGYLYRNTGTYASPVWNKIDHAVDKSLSLEAGEVDASDADSIWEFVEAGQFTMELEWDLIWHADGDDWEALITAFLDRENHIELAYMDGDITTSGEKGFRITARMLQASDTKEKVGPYKLQCKAKPAQNADGNPQRYTVP